MEFPVVFAILLGISFIELTSADLNMWSIQGDLTELNATCSPYDTCKQGRVNENLNSFSCLCNSACALQDTCCLDSEHTFSKPPKIRAACRSLPNGKSYFMVDRCAVSDDKNSLWENLCHEEWNGEDDIMKLVPVTSLFTHITYKNYFCFRCHEASDDYYYWVLELENPDYRYNHQQGKRSVSLSYDAHYGIWVANLGNGKAVIPVNISHVIPSEIYSFPVQCDPDVISQCSMQWNDNDVRDKCEAYMGVISIKKESTTLKYRNPHCALCNFEDLSNMECFSPRLFGFGAKVPFSFTHLLDINRSDGEKVGKIQKCQDGLLWDPYAQKCRNLSCAIPGYEVRNGRCVPP